MEIVLLAWVACGIAAAIIGSKKGEGCASFFVGFLFGPLGLLFAVLSSGNRAPCPWCKEMVHKKAVVCPYCRRTFGVGRSPH